jgi:hypothetical protein
MLSIEIKSIMLNVIMLSVVILNVVALLCQIKADLKELFFSRLWSRWSRNTEMTKTGNSWSPNSKNLSPSDKLGSGKCSGRRASSTSSSTTTSGANVIKLFTDVSYDFSKLERLSLASHFQPSLMFVGKSRSLPQRGGHKKVLHLVGSCLTCSCLTCKH